MANQKRHQTINNRERAVEERRTLKREAKQARRREVARSGEPLSPSVDVD